MLKKQFGDGLSFLVPISMRGHDVWPLRLPGGLKFWPRTLYQLSLARAVHARFVVTASVP